MTLTPTELQLVGGGLVFATALGSFWFFKRRSDRAAADINKTDEHSEQFDAIGEALTEDRFGRALSEKLRAGDRRKNFEQRRTGMRFGPYPDSSQELAIRESMSRHRPVLGELRPPVRVLVGDEPEDLSKLSSQPHRRELSHGAYPGDKIRLASSRESLEHAMVKPRVTPEQVSAHRLRVQQEEELRRRRRQNDEDSNLAATMAAIQLTNSDDNDSFKSGGGSFGGAGASSSWGGDSCSSSDSSSSSDSGGSCSSSD